MSLYVCVSYVACVSYTAKVASTICISLFANVGSRFFPRHFINRSYLSIYIYISSLHVYVYTCRYSGLHFYIRRCGLHHLFLKLPMWPVMFQTERERAGKRYRDSVQDMPEAVMCECCSFSAAQAWPAHFLCQLQARMAPKAGVGFPFVFCFR